MTDKEVWLRFAERVACGLEASLSHPDASMESDKFAAYVEKRADALLERFKQRWPNAELPRSAMGAETECLNALWSAVEQWRDEHGASCAEALYQVDRVNEALPDLAEACLNIVGYASAEDAP